MRIAVAGGTGTVGRYVVEEATDGGHDVIALSRSGGVDLVDGTGLAAALEGVDAIVDATNAPVSKQGPATEFFTAVAASLQRAAAEEGAGHVVTLSIVGIDSFDTGYYAAKREHERAALAGLVPATILRATQFHEFPARLLGASRDGVAHVPSRRVRTVAARTVARVLLELVEGAPRALAGELAGPEEADLVTLARAFAERRGLALEVVAEESRIPDRALLPAEGARIEGPSFAEWLASDDALRVPVPSVVSRRGARGA